MPAHAQWVQTKGPYGGWIGALVVTSDGVVFAGGDRGLYRSTNNGDFWEQVIHGLPPGKYISNLAISRNGTIFAAVENCVYRSTDKGNSWQLTNSGLPTSQIYVLTIDGNDRVFVSEGIIGTTGGIFFSSNGGDSWTQIDNGLPQYAALRSLVVNGSGHVFVGASSGIYRSTDLGNSWNKINTGFKGTWINALTINSKGHIIAALYDGIYRSTNNGDSWSRIGTAGTFYPRIFSRDRSGNLLAGVFKGIVRSTDDGDTWTNLGSGMPYSDVYAITFSPIGTMYSGTSGGVFRSMDGGMSWTRASAGLANTSIRALAVSPSGSVFAGANIDIFRSDDDGVTWKLASKGLELGWINTIVTSGASTVFASGSTGGRIFRSTDNGASWNGIYLNQNLFLAQTFCLAINSHGHIFAGVELGGIFRSTDNGDSWAQLNTGTSQNTYFHALAINSREHIFAGATRGTIGGPSAPGVYRSTDNGDSWMLDSSGLGNRDVWDLEINSGGQIFAAARGSVFCSADNGDSWRQKNAGLPETGVGQFAINSRDHIFALSAKGDRGYQIFRSTDNGDTWLAVGENPFGSQLYEVVIDKAGYIFAGTDAGVFRSAQPTTGETAFSLLPTQYVLEQNYPNPFNPGTTIQFELPAASFTTLKIFSLLGQEVAALVNELRNAGTHTVNWNAGVLPSGMYLCRLQAGGYVETKKMLLIK